MAEPTSENAANATENAPTVDEPPKVDQEDAEDWDKMREGNEPQNSITWTSLMLPEKVQRIRALGVLAAAIWLN
jgi:hypothetical protein